MSSLLTLPWHSIPHSTSTCTVHLLQAGGLSIPTSLALLPGPNQPTSPDLLKDASYYAPDYVFLIDHPPSGTKYIFDLGMRKDLENLPPTLVKNVLPQFKCEPQAPSDILKEHGSKEQQPETVKAVIFSHMHFDHVGDGAKAGFEHAEMWVGSTCCTYARPGYPVDEGAPTLSETLPVDGSRKIVEMYVPDEVLRDAGDKRAGLVNEGMIQGKYNAVDLKKPEWIGVGAFDRAFDVFGDGAAYLIDAPGHSAGHQMMLIRTTSDLEGEGKESTFVLLAGDCFHHVDILQDPRRTARPPYAKSGMHSDPEQALDTIYRTREFATKKNIWVIAAHDATVGESIAPGQRDIEGLIELNQWSEKRWKKAITSNL